MANNYYNFPVAFVPGTKVRSEQVNTQYQGLESAFDLLPTDPVASIIGTAWLAVDVQGATVNEYLLTNPDPQSALTNGQRVSFFATHTNTGAVTFNVDGLGVVNAVDNDGAVLGANDIILGQYYEFIYDNANTQFTRSLAAGSTSTFPQITATSSNVIDLVDVDVALRVGAVDPLTAAHLEFDPTTIQAKGDATNVNQLQLNPLGGEVAIGNQSGPATGEGILLYQDGFEMANIDRSAWAFSAADVWDPAVPDPYEFLFEFYDRDANNFWGSIGWDPATTDMRFQQFGDGGGFIFSGALDSGVPFELMTMDPEEGINFLPDGNSPLFVEPAGVSTVSGAVYLDNGATLYMAEITAAQVDIGGYGQLWVNDAFTPNRLFFTGDTGVDVDLTTVGGSPGGADTNIQYNNGGVFGGMTNVTYNDTTFEITYDPTLPGFGTGLRIEPVNTTGVSVRISDQTMALTSGQLLTASTEANHTGDLVNFSTVAAGASGDTLSIFHNSSASGFALNVTSGDSQVQLLNVQGAFTSIGIDDNATGERVQITDLNLTLGALGSIYNINQASTDGYILMTGGSTELLGGGIAYFGEANATNPGDLSFRSSNLEWMLWDESAGELSMLSGSGAKSQALRIEANTGLTIQSGARWLERADHVFTPAATFGELWVRNDAPNVLVFTDDAGTDFVLTGAGAAGPFTSDPTATTGDQIAAVANGALTSGSLLDLSADIGVTHTGTILNILQDNAAALSTGLTVTQDGALPTANFIATNAAAESLVLQANVANRTAAVLDIFQLSTTGGSNAIEIDHRGATGFGIDISISNSSSGGIRSRVNGTGAAFIGSNGTGSDGLVLDIANAVSGRTLPLATIEHLSGTTSGLPPLLQLNATSRGAAIEITGTFGNDGGGIEFLNTQVSSNVNALDAYEEGEFTATATAATGTITLNSGIDTLSYTRIGRLVHIQGQLEVGSVSSPTGRLRIEGLPYAIDSLTENAEDGCRGVWVQDITSDGNGLKPGFTFGFQTYIEVRLAAGTNTMAAQMQAGSNIVFDFCYTTGDNL